MASAVFSSFSNMLNLKSREVTPDETKPAPVYHDTQIPKYDTGIPLMGLGDYGGVKEVAPPPKEPPTTGIGSYRITTKKKVYAQIPGLSSGDMQTATASSQIPQYLHPPSTSQNVPINPLDRKILESATLDIFGDAKANDDQNQSYTFYNPSEFAPKSPLGENKNLTEDDDKCIDKTVLPEVPNHSRNIAQVDVYNSPALSQGSTVIIPPPPMFSNQRKESLTSVEKTVLPPSVARRISAKPTMKQPSPLPPSYGNLFVPQQIDVVTSASSLTVAKDFPIVPPSTSTMPQSMSSKTTIFAPTTSNTKSIPINNDKVKQDISRNATSQPIASMLCTVPPVNSHFNNSTLPTFQVPDTTTQTKPIDSIATTSASICAPTTVSNIEAYPSTVSSLSSESDLRPFGQTAPSSVEILTPKNIQKQPEERPTLPSFTDLYSSNLDNATNTIVTTTAFNSRTNVTMSQTFVVTTLDLPASETSSRLDTYLTGQPGVIPSTLSSQETPIFFNPNTLQTILPIVPKHDEIKDKNKSEQLSQSAVSQFCAPEKNKPPIEPPKSSGPINFRLNKKRPQYYSGPIEGIGAIGNNIKPLIEPVRTEEFQGSLFVPDLAPPASLPGNEAEKSEPALFDLSKSTDNTSFNTPFDINRPQVQAYPQYNTPFDFSRPANESYESPKQDSKGYGIIGSLKSKLSSIDINKIQSSVTTFFDPSYNDTKTGSSDQQDNTPYIQSEASFKEYQGNNFEIFVPNIEQPSRPYNNNYNSQAGYQNPTYNYTQGNQNSNPYNYFPTDGTTGYSSSYFTEQPHTASVQNNQTSVSDFFATHNTVEAFSSSTKPKEFRDNNPKDNYNPQMVTSIIESASCDMKIDTDSMNKDTFNTEEHVTVDTESKTYFDVQPSLHAIKPEELSEKLSALQLSLSENIADVMEKDNDEIEKYKTDTNDDNVAPTFSYFTTNDLTQSNDYIYSGNTKPHISEEKSEPTLKNIENLDLNSLSILLPAPVEKSKGSEKLNLGIHSDSAHTLNVGHSFLYKESDTQSLLDESDKGSELSICETCREVNKPEEKEREDLTDQLIENITSQIQLSNPVEVPLPDSNPETLVSALSAGFDEGNADQCAEITHIIEETIEAIHVKSAVELLDDDDEIVNMPTYGWNVDNAYAKPNSLNQDYDYPPPNIGFFGDSFFDNIPNASDEVKAELKAHEDSPSLLPRQMSVPSAPPAEDVDDESDDTGDLDVHSIELDAKKDFPIFDEFVAEPSETDDDKIEFKERRASEDVQDADTFTKRVDKFKTENAGDEKNLGGYSLDVSNPAVTLTSYFDTGNYAAEAHFQRFKYQSELDTYGYSVNNFRIPPGFEKEYETKLYDMANSNAVKTFSNEASTVLSSNIITAKCETPSTVFSFTQSAITSDPWTRSHQEPSSQPELNEEKLPKLPLSDCITKKEDKGDAGASETKIESRQQNDNAQSSALPDPLNFFTTPTVSDVKPAEDPIGFNRLASYFASPVKKDNAKSFFVSSESETSYRQNQSNSTLSSQITDNVTHKPFFELRQSQNHYVDSKNVPSNEYQANLKLLRDLTSYQNMETPKEHIVRTVNYFTIEYDNNLLNSSKCCLGEAKTQRHIVKNGVYKNPNLHIGKDKTELAKLDNDNVSDNKLGEINDDDLSDRNSTLGAEVKGSKDKRLDDASNTVDDFYDVLSNCKSCCSLRSRSFIKDNNADKVRQSADSKSEDDNKKDISRDMSGENREGRREIARDDLDLPIGEEPNEGVTMMTENRSSTEYVPVKHHWFYREDSEGKSLWKGFSMVDSRALEEAFKRPDLNEHTTVATDGGRYDVNIVGRLRTAVYWAEKPTNVRRCSWFYKGDIRYVPYSEVIAEKLEEEYHRGVTTNEWHRQLPLPNNEMVVMHGPSVIAHFLQASPTDPFSPPNQTTPRPRVVRRGYEESEIEDTEPSSIDHLLLLCHGVGSACDMRFRPVEEVVNDFRATSLQLIQSHYKNSYDSGVVGRVEVLPISWHSTLHSGPRGVDRLLSKITLESIPMLRNFTNDTILDVLFYTSPVYSQTIIDTVCSEMNRIYKLFKSRNPTFSGGVSLGGHSLGSVVLYDLLSHQSNPSVYPVPPASTRQLVKGAIATQPSVEYPKLDFSPDALFALGSPIAIFECIRGVESLGENFALPTCKKFFNIFHPYDPIAYRIEPLINAGLQKVKPVLIPHHKGRKRMHLELKETMTRVGADLKQRVLESIKATWASMWRSQAPTHTQLERVVEEEIEKESQNEEGKEEPAQDFEPPASMLGELNSGRRVDYVLQEAPFEIIYEYLFAMKSHVCYWMSEDTMLMILREIYSSMGVCADGSVSAPGMTVERTRAVKQEDGALFTGLDGPSTSSKRN